MSSNDLPAVKDLTQKLGTSRDENSKINAAKEQPETESRTLNDEAKERIIDQSSSSRSLASLGPHARISSQVDAISYEETCPINYPPNGVFYTSSKNVDEKSLPMDELEMKKRGLVDSQCQHRPFDTKGEACESCKEMTPISKMIPFDEFQLKQCGFIDPAGHHMDDMRSTKSIGRKGDPRHAQLANEIVDDTKLCDIYKSSKSITDNTKSIDSAYPRILKFDDMPLLSTAEDDNNAPTLPEKSIEKGGSQSTTAGKSRYKLNITGQVKVRSRRRWC